LIALIAMLFRPFIGAPDFVKHLDVPAQNQYSMGQLNHQATSPSLAIEKSNSKMSTSNQLRLYKSSVLNKGLLPQYDEQKYLAGDSLQITRSGQRITTFNLSEANRSHAPPTNNLLSKTNSHLILLGEKGVRNGISETAGLLGF
jgi:hypothetical protein